MPAPTLVFAFRYEIVVPVGRDIPAGVIERPAPMNFVASAATLEIMGAFSASVQQQQAVTKKKGDNDLCIPTKTYIHSVNSTASI
ncbi:MAG: hypothetical protein KGZ88_09290 [Methylomicrobium sp.]|nr:hypothetical protein [Methylomicrobium sp.]